MPFVPLKAAAGAFGEPHHFAEGEYPWVSFETRRKLRAGMFVAQVVGKSMEPAIADGSYCLFAAPVEGTRQGRTVLVQLRDSTDPETGERYTVKRYASRKAKQGDTWRHIQIVLEPLNSSYDPIVLTPEYEGEVRVIAEWIETL